MGASDPSESGKAPQQASPGGGKADLLAELREFARAIKEIDGVQATRETPRVAPALPLVARDRRGRPSDVWDTLGRQISFFYAAESGQPYAYEMKNENRQAIERGSTTGPNGHWVIYRNDDGLAYDANPKDVFTHPVVRVEVTPDGAFLANASDGYQLRRDPSGVEFEAMYDMRGCLIEAIRRHSEGADRTKWHYDDDGNTVAREERADGAVVESSYDKWGRMLLRSETINGVQSSTQATYNADGSHTVKRTETDEQVVEELRRRDGTLSRSRQSNLQTEEVVARTYDERERVLEEEVRTPASSQVTAWRYGEDGWTEVSQSTSDGKQLEARYDGWGRLVLQKESTPEGKSLTRFSYKPDGSYNCLRETSDGMTAEEYYRSDGTRHYSKATYKDGQVVEVDYDPSGRPLKRTSTTVHHYE